MATYTVTAPSEDKGYGVRYELLVGRIEGIHSSYGPAGFGLLMIPRGCDGRRETGGPMFAGPWGSFVGQAAVIDNYGGSGRTTRQAIDEGRYIAFVADGDRFVIDGETFAVRVEHRANHALLLPVEPLSDDELPRP